MTTRTSWALPLGCVAALFTTSCAASFSNEAISGYAATWAYSVSSLNIVCSGSPPQRSSGSGQIVLSIPPDDPTMLVVAASTLCGATAPLAPQVDGYDLGGNVPCPSDAGAGSTLTQYHVAVDSHHPDTLLFSRTTSSTQPGGGTCTSAESGTATKT